MTKYARIVDDVAAEVVEKDPFEMFHPDIAKEFVTVPDDVAAGSVKKGAKWTDPIVVVPPVIDPVVKDKIIPVLDFVLMFTSAERVAIKASRQDDPVIDDIMDLIEDQRLSTVNLSSETIKQSIDYMISKDLIKPERKSDILG